MPRRRDSAGPMANEARRNSIVKKQDKRARLRARHIAQHSSPYLAKEETAAKKAKSKPMLLTIAAEMRLPRTHAFEA